MSNESRKKVALGNLCYPPAGQIQVVDDALIDYIDISSVSNESKSITGYQTLRFSEAPSRARKPLKKDSILVSTVRPNLNAVALFDFETQNTPVASTGFCVLDCKEEVDPRFVFNFCKSQTFISDMVSQATGASYPAVSDKIVRTALIPEYSYKEQCVISSVLEKIAHIIDNRKKQLAALDDLIKARFVEMFGTVHNNVFQFAECTLESISDEFFAGGDKPADCTTERDEAHPYPVFANGYDNEGLQGYSAKCRVTQPAVTISARGTIGYCFIREAGFTPVVRLVTIVPNNKVSPVFLKHAIDTMDIKSSGTSQAQLTVPDFKRERIIVPPVELQGQFAAFVSQVDKSKVVIQKALDEAQILFDSLMQQYFG